MNRGVLIPAIGVGLQPWELVYTGATNWGAWDPRAATGQSGCLSPASRGIHIIHINIYFH